MVDTDIVSSAIGAGNLFRGWITEMAGVISDCAAILTCMSHLESPSILFGKWSYRLNRMDSGLVESNYVEKASLYVCVLFKGVSHPNFFSIPKDNHGCNCNGKYISPCMFP
jgi:hypothetical protein